MTHLVPCKVVMATVLLVAGSILPGPVSPDSARGKGERPEDLVIQGTVLEGCSCQIPCPCNFGQPASPHRLCAFLAFFAFNRGQFAGVSLAGHRFAVASNGENQTIIYVDPDGSASETRALLRIARWIIGHEGIKDRAVLRRPIRVDLLATRSFGYVVGEETSLRAHPLTGNDGKSTIEVTNPWLFGSWPVSSAQKGSSELLQVHSGGISFRYSGTNANKATFEFLAGSVPSEAP